MAEMGTEPDPDSDRSQKFRG